MKISLERLAKHRFHTLELAIKDLSLEELESFSAIMANDHKLTSKSKRELVDKEILMRKSHPLIPTFIGLGPSGISN